MRVRGVKFRLSSCFHRREKERRLSVFEVATVQDGKYVLPLDITHYLYARSWHPQALVFIV